MEYTELPIFRDIGEEDIHRMLRCFSVRRADYRAGEVI